MLRGLAAIAKCDPIRSRVHRIQKVLANARVDPVVFVLDQRGGVLLVNSIKAEVAKLLTEAGQPPKVLTAGAIVGAERATELFEAAYDEHAHRLARLFENV